MPNSAAPRRNWHAVGAPARRQRLEKRLDGNRQRGIVLSKVGRAWVFVFLFAKRDRDDIDERELRAFRKLAADIGRRSDTEVATLIALKELVEICNG